MIKRKCWYCGDEFETNDSGVYYCSIECEERELETDVMSHDDSDYGPFHPDELKDVED